MNESFFRISSLQGRIDSNTNLRVIMKTQGALIVSTIFICSLNQAAAMKTAWIISIVFMLLLFSIEFYLIKQNRILEFQIYRLMAEDMAYKKRMAEITGDDLTDTSLSAAVPSTEIHLPVLYYAILIFLDTIVKIVFIH